MNKTFYGTASITNSNRIQIINHSITKGPGAYDVYKENNQNSLPKWTLKPKLDNGSCFKNTKENIPPPGSYNISTDIKHKVKLANPNYRSEKYKQTTQKLNHMSSINLPTTLNTSISASFGYRGDSILFKENSQSPGPIYNVHQIVEKDRNKKIKNTCRGFGYGQKNGLYKVVKDQLPGPGAYNATEKSPEKISSPKSTFGKAKKEIVIITNPLGPGEYNPSNTVYMRSFKLKGKLPEAIKYTNPNGPGTYDLPDTKSKKGPKFNLHRRTRSSDMNEQPDPFTYECKRYPDNIENNKGFSLGKKVTENVGFMQKNPGPGAYQVSEDLSKPHNGGYMGRKVVIKKKNVVDDCFGKYDPNINAAMRESAIYSFSYEAKPWDKPYKEQTIGPGYYNIKEKRNVEGYKMGRSQRFKQQKCNEKVVYNEQGSMYSTIGFLPSYLKNDKLKKQKIKNNSIQVLKQKVESKQNN